MPRRSEIPPLGDVTDSEEEFLSPDEVAEQTDYRLSYSISNRENPKTPSTRQSAKKTPIARKQQPTARKRTGGDVIQTNQEPLRQSEPAHRRKNRKPMHRSLRLLNEIKFLMNTTRTLIPKLPFGRVVREILMRCPQGNMLRITKTALEALHESTELYITQQLQDAYTLTLHRGRVTLSVKDMELLRFLRGRI